MKTRAAAKPSNTLECGLQALSFDEIKTKSNVIEDGMTIFYKSVTTTPIRTVAWKRGIVQNVGNGISPSTILFPCTKRIAREEGAGKGNILHLHLGPHNCGDGSDSNQIWFPVVKKEANDKEELFKYKKAYQSMVDRNKLTLCDVIADGHCGRRSMCILIFGSDSLENMISFKTALSDALANEKFFEDFMASRNAETRDVGVDGKSWKSLFSERSKMYKDLNCEESCVGDFSKYLSLEDMFFVSRQFNRRTLVSIGCKGAAAEFTSFKPERPIETIPFAHYIHIPDDIALHQVWNGEHFNFFQLKSKGKYVIFPIIYYITLRL